MTAAREPGINIRNVRLLVCRKHESALAQDPSVNAILFPIEVLNAVLADERCQIATEGKVENVSGFIERIAPACEWIGHDAATLAWRRARALGRGHRA